MSDLASIAGSKAKCLEHFYEVLDGEIDDLKERLLQMKNKPFAKLLRTFGVKKAGDKESQVEKLSEAFTQGEDEVPNDDEDKVKVDPETENEPPKKKRGEKPKSEKPEKPEKPKEDPSSEDPALSKKISVETQEHGTIDVRIDPEIERMVPKASTDEMIWLRRDIDDQGMIDEILVYPDGRIIDGHSRFRCLVELGEDLTEDQIVVIDPDGDELEKIICSKNLVRRQISAIRKVDLAAKYLPSYKSLSRREKAERSGVSESTIQQIEENIQRWCPDLYEKVLTGELPQAATNKEVNDLKAVLREKNPKLFRKIKKMLSDDEEREAGQEAFGQFRAQLEKDRLKKRAKKEGDKATKGDTGEDKKPPPLGPKEKAANEILGRVESVLGKFADKEIEEAFLESLNHSVKKKSEREAVEAAFKEVFKAVSTAIEKTQLAIIGRRDFYQKKGY